MKKFTTVILSLMIVVGMVSCGANETADESAAESKKTASASVSEEQSDEVSSVEENTESEGNTESTDTDESHEDSSLSGDDVILDENEEPVFIDESELDAALSEKIYALLNAASNGDKNTYLELSDIEELSAVSGGNIDEERLIGAFEELNEKFGGGFGDNLWDITSDISESESTSDCTVYYISFFAKGKDADLLIWCDAFDHNGKWSVKLELFSVVEHTYYDYEDLIIEQMNAAAAGDQDKYMECLNLDVFKEVFTYRFFNGAEGLDRDEMKELNEMLEEIPVTTYEDLNEALGKDFDGKILQVQMFELSDTEDIDMNGAEISERFVITIRNSDGDFQEVEGIAYSLDGKKGVWLQPD